MKLVVSSFLKKACFTKKPKLSFGIIHRRAASFNFCEESLPGEEYPKKRERKGEDETTRSHHQSETAFKLQAKALLYLS